MVVAEHRRYLCDEQRFAAYDLALAVLCASKPIVLDLGAGSGLLGLTALKHGATRVHGVEATGLVDWTKAVSKCHGEPGRYVVHAGKSREISLPEPVDLVVCDQFGGFLLEGEPFPALADAAERHLRRGGTLVPYAVDFWVAALASERLAGDLAFWSEEHFGLDVRSLRSLEVGTLRWERTEAAELASAGGLLGTVATERSGPSVDFTTKLTLGRETVVNAVAGWFEAHLAAGISFGTAPGDPKRIDRENVVLPVDPPIACAAGDELQVRIRASFGAGVMSWIVSKGDEVRKHSTWSAFSAAPIARG